MERMERSKYPEDEDGARIAAVGWKGFERTTPFIEDNDPDMETHDMKFDQMIKCMSLTRHKPRAMCILTMYGQGFKQGSARAKVYHNAFRRATVPRKLGKYFLRYGQICEIIFGKLN